MLPPQLSAAYWRGSPASNATQDDLASERPASGSARLGQGKHIARANPDFKNMLKVLIQLAVKSNRFRRKSVTVGTAS